MKWSALLLLTLALLIPATLQGQQTPTPQPTHQATTKKIDHPLETWKTTTGPTYIASLESYDLKSKELILEDTRGAAVRVPAVQLDGPTKVQWLSSPVTFQALAKNYPWKDNISGLLSTFGVFLICGVVAGFLFYWLAVSIVAGNGNPFRALKSYILANLGVFVVYLCWGLVTFILITYLKEHKVLPFLLGGFSILAIIASLAIYCRIVAMSYEISGCAGLGVLIICGIFVSVMKVALYFGWPILMADPVFDHWASHYLLKPLGLL